MTSDCCCCCKMPLNVSAVIWDPVRSWEDCSWVMVTVSIPAALVADMINSFSTQPVTPQTFNYIKIALLQLVTMVFVSRQIRDMKVRSYTHTTPLEESSSWSWCLFQKKPAQHDLCTRLRMRNEFVSAMAIQQISLSCIVSFHVY